MSHFFDPWLRAGSPERATPPLAVTVAAVAAAAVPLALYRYHATTRTKPNRQYPPGPPGLPILGNLLQLPGAGSDRTLDDQLFDWAQEYGLVYSLHLLGLGTWVIIADPDLVRRICVTKNYEKSRDYELLRAVAGSESLVLVDKAHWRPKRKAFNPGFAPAFLKDTVQVMADKLRRFAACIDGDIASGRPTDMLRRSQTFTSDVIVAVAFGEDWGGDAPHPAREWNDELSRLFAATVTNPLLQLFGFWIHRQIRRYEALIDGEMMRILERRLADGGSTSTGGPKSDICSLAIEQLRRDGGPLTATDMLSIAHQLKTFYFAGHDTTATTIAWAIWLLAQHPDVLDKLRAELRERGVWTNPDSPPTFDELQQCAFLEATIKETLRLYPPASLISRETDDPDAEWQGHRLSGAVLVIETFTLGRDPRLWNDPDAFHPDRFLDGSEEPPQSKYSINDKFTAFSRGPRDCIGKYFALLEAKLAVAALVTRYDFDCVDPKERMKLLITTMPANGAAVWFRHRNV